MSAEIIPFKAPQEIRAKCCFCGKEIPKGTMALVNTERNRWMCRGCIQEAYIRMGAVG